MDNHSCILIALLFNDYKSESSVGLSCCSIGPKTLAVSGLSFRQWVLKKNPLGKIISVQRELFFAFQ